MWTTSSVIHRTTGHREGGNTLGLCFDYSDGGVGKGRSIHPAHTNSDKRSSRHNLNFPIPPHPIPSHPSAVHTTNYLTTTTHTHTTHQQQAPRHLLSSGRQVLGLSSPSISSTINMPAPIDISYAARRQSFGQGFGGNTMSLDNRHSFGVSSWLKDE